MLLAVIRPLKELDEDTLEELGQAIETETHRQYAEKVSPTFAEKISAAIYGKAIVVRTEDPAVAAIEKGQRPRIMWEMVGRVVPMRTKSGVTIYRKVTIEAIARGKWHRRGVPGKRLVEKAAQSHHLKSGLQVPVSVQTIM